MRITCLTVTVIFMLWAYILPAQSQDLNNTNPILVNEAKADQEIWLSSLDVSNICSAGYGRIVPDRTTFYNTPLSIGGRKFEKGCGVLAHSIIYIDLKKAVGTFSSCIGVDDVINDPDIAVKFRVLGDGSELYNSGVIHYGDKAKDIEINVSDIDRLILLVLPISAGKHGNAGLRSAADWADAKFTKVKEMPQIILPPIEDKYILTPIAPKKPRINGPSLYGVRPESPVLFRIPATGDRPIKFSVVNMPQGLSLNENDGIISGSIAVAGQYNVTLAAQNEHGKDERDFRFVVGNKLALTPPMGWNSWYVHTDNVNDQKIRLAAEAMVKSGLVNYGYSYINIDDTWMVRPTSDDPLLIESVADPEDMKRRIAGYNLKSQCECVYIPNPRDCSGQINSNDKFPDMRSLADHVHSLGLKIGIYSSPGTLTCGGYIGSFQHENKDAQRFAEWGFDFLKYDWCHYQAGGPDPGALSELQKPFITMSQALQRQKRDVVFNLCQYGAGRVWDWGADVGAHSWRTDGDLGATVNPHSFYCNMISIAFGQNGLETYAGPGHWNDPDYIFGFDGSPQTNYKISPNEQYTYMSIWSLLAAPLIYSGDMTQLDDFTLNILCNNEIIAVNQDPLGVQANRICIDDDSQIWAKKMEDGSMAVGLFNIGESDITAKVPWSDLKIKGKQKVRDLWRQEDIGVFNEKFEMNVPRHGAALIQLSPVK